MDLISGTGGDDRIDGTDGGERIAGLDGDDVLQGLGGNDRLYGGLGDDTLLGGSGDDTLYGGGGVDLIQGGSGDDVIFENQIGIDVIDGGSGRDTLDLTGAPEGIVVQLISQGTYVVKGIDSVLGSAFDDTIEAGAGKDVLRGMDGDDVLSAEGYRETKPDVLFGGDGNDMLFGATISRLVGGAGEDTLSSNLGADTMSGGEGADLFDLRYYASDPHGAARITDLADEDTISIRAFDNGGWTVVAGFTGHRHEAMLSYDAGADTTSLLFDLDGDAVADVSVAIDGDHADFHHFIL